MKKILIGLLMFTTTLTSFANPDEEVVKAMARQTNISEDEIRASYDACGSGVTWTMKICASYHWMVEDVRLNKIYKITLKSAKESGYEKTLIQAQKNWIGYRDVACQFEGEMGAGGGTMEGLYVLSCKEELTKDRADRLEKENQSQP